MVTRKILVKFCTVLVRKKFLIALVGRLLEIISCNMKQVFFWTMSFLTFSCSCHRLRTELKRITNIRIQWNYGLLTLILGKLVKTLTLRRLISKMWIGKKQKESVMKVMRKAAALLTRIWSGTLNVCLLKNLTTIFYGSAKRENIHLKNFLFLIDNVLFY